MDGAQAAGGSEVEQMDLAVDWLRVDVSAPTWADVSAKWQAVRARLTALEEVSRAAYEALPSCNAVLEGSTASCGLCPPCVLCRALDQLPSTVKVELLNRCRCHSFYGRTGRHADGCPAGTQQPVLSLGMAEEERESAAAAKR